MFCANCRLVFQQDHSDDYWDETRKGGRQFSWNIRHSYGISCEDFLLAAAKCHCCHELLRQLKLHDPSFPGSAQKDLRIRLEWEVIVEAFPDTTGYLCVRAYFRDPDLREPDFRDPDFVELDYSAKAQFRTSILGKFRNTGGHDDVRLRDLINEPPINSTGSDYTARFVKSCLERCKSYHTKCQSGSKDAPWYPTRLVEIMDSGCARVIETQETIPTGPYATLSHCWGESRIFTATTTNIESLKKHIPLLDLPKTFRDALQFTNSIGISYIWIDSICIIQDSIKDWEFESRTMLRVYRHAECNLAAAVSEDSHAGLFSQRDHAILPSGWFESENNIPELKGLHCAVPQIGYGDLFEAHYCRNEYWKDEFEKEIGSSRLLGRGWIYQERAASNRVVAFGRDQVFWDCSELLESDILPGYRISLESWSDHITFFGMAIPKHLTPAIPHTIESYEDGLVEWQRIVERYGACDFTFMKDKPVAILGVAEMMSTTMKTQLQPISTAYWTGLWFPDMERQLTWTLARHGLRRNNHAPSWSWSSIEGPVQWQWPDDRGKYAGVSALVTVALPDAQAMDSNSEFCDLSADLKIWCSLHAVQIPAQDRRCGPKTGFAPQGDESPDPYFRCDCDDMYLMNPSESFEHVCSPNLTFTEQIDYRLYSVRFDCEDVDTENLYFLPLIHTCVLREYTPAKYRVDGIIVRPADNQLGTYRRCGRARVSPLEDGEWVRTPDWADYKPDALMVHTFNPLRRSPSDVDFMYGTYDAELGYLIHLV